MIARTVTIVVRDGNDFDVHVDDKLATRLCWDEMLGCVAEATHPQIGGARYLRTLDQHYTDMQRRGAAFTRAE